MEGIENLPGEEWKDVPGYEGLYKASNMGRILSLRTNKILSTFIQNKRPYVYLYTYINNQQKITYRSVASCVYKAFRDSNYNRLIHLDGDYFNCKLSNLSGISTFAQHKEDEIFLDLPLFEGIYKISNYGRIFSLISGKYLSSRLSKSSITPLVQLTISTGCVKTFNIARLVYSTFVSPLSDSDYVILKDKDSTNLHVSNLQKLTKDEYYAHVTKNNIHYKIGDNIGRFIITERTPKKSTYTLKCTICNKLIDNVAAPDIKRDHKCDCFVYPSTVHGFSNNANYVTYYDMIRRCYNPKHISYPTYGAQGIFVCDLWRNSYETFNNWYIIAESDALRLYDKTEYISKNGKTIERPTRLSIERVNPNGPYAPWNCTIIPLRLNSSKEYNDKQREKYPKSGPLRIQTDAELRKQRRVWYKEALERGEIDAKYYRKQITRLD